MLVNPSEKPERAEVAESGGRAVGRGESAPERVRLGVFVGRIVGGFAGSCLGITLGVWTGWGAAPLILGVLGIGAGSLLSDFVFKLFPRLAPEQTITARAAAAGLSGLFVGMLVGDIVGAFTSLDRLYTVLVGAGVGFYVGVLLGTSRKGK